MSESLLKDKVIVVTGATKGMGLAASTELLKLGAKVVMVYCSDTETAKHVQEKLTGHQSQLLLLKADITKSKDRESIVKQTLETFQRVDVLVNNAGIAARSGFLNESEEDFDKVVNVNLKAPIFLAKLVAKQMIAQGEGGSIINFSSISGHRGTGGISYDAAKAGIIRATQTMANTLGKHGIRVNSISPGYTQTEMNRDHWENESDTHKKIVEIMPLRRAAKAKEIAGTVIYLASDQSSFTTGADILVDGGYLALLPGREK